MYVGVDVNVGVDIDVSVDVVVGADLDVDVGLDVCRCRRVSCRLSHQLHYIYRRTV